MSLGGSSGSKEFRLEGGGGYQQGRSQRTDAIVSKINTQGNVTLKAGADLTTKGMQIGKQGTRASDVSLLAAGEVKLLAAVSGSADINDSALADFRLGGKRATGGASKEGLWEQAFRLIKSINRFLTVRAAIFIVRIRCL